MHETNGTTLNWHLASVPKTHLLPAIRSRQHRPSNRWPNQRHNQERVQNMKCTNTWNDIIHVWLWVTKFKSQSDCLYLPNWSKNSELRVCERAQTHLRPAIRSQKDRPSNQSRHQSNSQLCQWPDQWHSQVREQNRKCTNARNNVIQSFHMWMWVLWSYYIQFAVQWHIFTKLTQEH